MAPVLICDIHGCQGCSFVSPGVRRAFDEKSSTDDFVFLVLLREGEWEECFNEMGAEEFDKDEEFRKDYKFMCYFARTAYVKKEELGVYPLVGKLSKDEHKYEYVMTFKDEVSIYNASSLFFMGICSKCFAEFVSDNSDIIYSYHPEAEPPDW